MSKSKNTNWDWKNFDINNFKLSNFNFDLISFLNRNIILIIVSIKNIIHNPKYLKDNEFLITLSLIGSSYALIAHQLMTINGIFIFFIIPILTGFSHIYYLNHYKNNKYILHLLIFLALIILNFIANMIE